MQVASRAQTGNIIASTGLLRIGGNSIWSESFKGTIDEVRVFSPRSDRRGGAVGHEHADLVGHDATHPADQPRDDRPALEQHLALLDRLDGQRPRRGLRPLQERPAGRQLDIDLGDDHGAHLRRQLQVAVDAYDDTGNRSPQTTITALSGDCDTISPTVQITSPSPGTVAGTVTVSALANDNLAVVGVQFKLDGNNLGAEDTTAPFSVSWDTTAGPNGNHVLAAVARDGSGNRTTSDSVSVNVLNQAPNFVGDKVIVGLNEPTNMLVHARRAHADRRARRTIWVVPTGATAVDPTPFLTVPSVDTDDERGLLGITLDPNFATNGYVYVFYTHARTLRNRVSRFTATGNAASLAGRARDLAEHRQRRHLAPGRRPALRARRQPLRLGRRPPCRARPRSA